MTSYFLYNQVAYRHFNLCAVSIPNNAMIICEDKPRELIFKIFLI